MRSRASARFVDNVPSIGHLRGRRCSARSRTGVHAISVAADDLDTWMILQPLDEPICGGIVKPVNDAMRVSVDQDGAITTSAPKGEFVNPELARGYDWRLRQRAHQAQQGRPTGGLLLPFAQPVAWSTSQRKSDEFEIGTQASSAPSVPPGERRHLLNKGATRTGRFVASKATDVQADDDLPIKRVVGRQCCARSRCGTPQTSWRSLDTMGRAPRDGRIDSPLHHRVCIWGFYCSPSGGSKPQIMQQPCLVTATVTFTR